MTLRLVRRGIKPLHARTILHGQEEVETIIDIPFSTTIGGTCFEYGKLEEKKREITWDPQKEKVLSINLRGSAFAEFPFPGSFNIQLFLYVNDNLVVSRVWTPFDSGLKSWDTNIGAHIINGWNTFKAEISKPGCNAWVKGLNVEVSFLSNIIPRVREPRPWWFWPAVGMGSIAFLGLVVVPLIKKSS